MSLNFDPLKEKQEKIERGYRSRGIYIFSAAILVAALIAFIVVPNQQSGETERLTNIISLGAIGLYSIVGLILNARKRTYEAITGLIFVVLIVSIAAGIIAAYPLQTSILFISLTTIILITTAMMGLPPTWANRAIPIVVISQSIRLFIETWIPDQRLSTPEELTYMAIFNGVFGIIAIVVFVQQFSAFSLRTKLILTFVVITITPVVLIAGFNNIATTDQLNTTARIDLQESGLQVAQSIDNFWQNQKDNLRIEAQLPYLSEYVQANAAQRIQGEIRTNALDVLQTLVRKDSIYILSYAIVDLRGTNLLDTNAENIGKIEPQTDYLQQALADNLPTISAVRIENDRPVIYLATPLRNNDNEAIGLLRVQYDANIIQQNISQFAGLEGHERRYIVVVDPTLNIRLAHSKSPHLLLSTYASISPEVMIAYQQQGILQRAPYGRVVTPQLALIDALKTIDNTPFFEGRSSTYPQDIVLTYATQLENANWIVLIREPVLDILAPVDEQTRNAVRIGIVLIALITFAGFFVSSQLATPLVELTQTAQQITAGDLTIRSTIETEDEIGSLAYAFNQMTAQLQQTLQGMEERIRERTRELERSNQRTRERVQELQIVSEVSKTIAQEKDPDTLLTLITNIVSDRFDFYHVGIFLVDEARRFAVLKASNSEGGQRMLERGHHLEIGQKGIVGYVADTGEPRIALDVGDDAVFFNNPDLPRTRSEIGVPLIIQGEVIGVLDVQSEKSAAFTEEDASILSTLADQISIALQNARQVAETERALNETQTLYRQYLLQGWENAVGKKAFSGYHHGMGRKHPLQERMKNAAIEQASISGRIITQPGSENQGEIMVVPLKVREQIIGIINIQQSEAEHTWLEDDIRVAQAIADRIAFALENARLFEETSARAARERTVADIANKIRATNDPETMMQIAAQELKKALHASRVQINPYRGQTETGNPKQGK
jgi:GAF domain-containing protein/HAMP domain-containing protein